MTNRQAIELCDGKTRRINNEWLFLKTEYVCACTGCCSPYVADAIDIKLDLSAEKKQFVFTYKLAGVKE